MADPKARIVIDADASAAERRLAQLRDSFARLGQSLPLARITALSTAFSGLFAGVAVGAAAASFKQIVGQLDDLADRAQGLGIAASELSTFELAARGAGLGSEEFASGIAHFNRRLVDAAQGGKDSAAIFDALGVRIRGANGELRAGGEVLKDVADRFAQYADGANKSALAQELFARGGRRFIALLNEGREGLTKFGGASDAQIESARRLQEQIDRLSAAWERLKLAVGGGVAGVVNRALGIENFGTQALEKQRESVEKVIAGVERELAGIPNPDIGTRRKFLEKELERLRGVLEGIKSAQREALSGGKPSAPPFGAEEQAATRVRAKVEDAAEAFRKYADGIYRSALAAAQGEQAYIAMEAAIDAAGRRAREEQEQRLASLTGRAGADRVLADMKLIDDAFFEGKISVQEYDNAIDKVFGIETQQAIERSTSLVEQLGLTFSSAFEDAIVKGEGLRNVLQAIGQDLLRIFVRKNITEPAGAFLAGLLNFGGARAAGGPVIGGSAYLVGERGPELFVPRSSGAIVPNGAAVSVTVAPTIYIDSRTDRAQIAVAVDQAMRMSERRIFENMRRGGAFANA
jgi:hypothetical protein